MEGVAAVLLLVGFIAWLVIKFHGQKGPPKSSFRPREKPSGGADKPQFTVTVESTVSRGYSRGDDVRHRRSAFDRVVPDTLPKEIRESLWGEFRSGEGDLARAFGTILSGVQWDWPWLDQTRREAREIGEPISGWGLAEICYSGPPRPPENVDELLPMLKVADIRKWAKESDRYPSPAPKKKAEFEALVRQADWSDLEELAIDTFREQKHHLERRYESCRVELLASTLNFAYWQEQRFDRGVYCENGSWLIWSDHHIFAARECLKFLKRQDRPLPPFYPGDRSGIEPFDPDDHNRYKRRLRDAVVKPGEDSSVGRVRSYRANWLNAQDATACHEYELGRKFWITAMNAVAGLEGHEGNARQITDEAADAVESDPVYQVVLFAARSAIRSQDQVIQSEFYDFVRKSEGLDLSDQELRLLLFLAAKRGDVSREKAGNSYLLKLGTH